MRIKKYIFFIIVLMGSLTGSENLKEIKAKDNGSMEDVIELSLLYSGSDVTWVAAMETLCDEFMEQNPDIIINTENSGEANCENELKVKEALDEFPDIFELENVDTFAEAGKLGAIDAEVSDMVTNVAVIGKKSYGLPIYATTNGVIYNKNIFKKYDLEIPDSYADFIQICDTLKSKGICPLAIGGNQEENMTYWLNYFFQKDILEEKQDWLKMRKEEKVKFTDAESIDMLEELEELFSKGYILEDSENMTENQIVTRMTENQFAMVYAGPWLFTKIIDAYPMCTESDKTPLGEEIAEDKDSVTYRLGWFFLEDDKGNLTALTRNNAYWAISETCAEDARKKEAAQRFLKFFYTKENYRSMIQGMYGLPVTKEAIIYPAPSAQQKLLKDYRYSDKNTVYLGMQGTATSFLSDVNKVLKELYTGEYTVEKTAEEIDLAWDRETWEE